MSAPFKIHPTGNEAPKSGDNPNPKDPNKLQRRPAPPPVGDLHLDLNHDGREVPPGLRIFGSVPAPELPASLQPLLSNWHLPSRISTRPQLPSTTNEM